METAPLTLAHAHAQSAHTLQNQGAHARHFPASAYTAQPPPSATGPDEADLNALKLAGEQHVLAAENFEKARVDVQDPEALRTLELLEKHHKSLAESIKQLLADAASPSTSPDKAQHAPNHANPVHAPSRSNSGKLRASMSASALISPVAPGAGFMSNNSREANIQASLSTTKLASNLATARGIHKQPPSLYGQSSSTRPGAVTEALARRQQQQQQQQQAAQQPRPAPPDILLDGASPPASSTTSTFETFYANLESLLSRISNPAAFAGLPLDGSEPPADLIHALGGTKRAPLPSESFYIVPVTGGTMTYAGILKNSNEELEGDPELLDAAVSTILPTKVPAVKVTPGGRGRGVKTHEELLLENGALKNLTDTLSRRLHAYELSSHSQARELKESMRILKSHMAHPAQSLSPHADAVAGEPTLRLRIRDLETELARTRVENEKLKLENGRYKSKIKEYQDRWERLKEGAKNRRASGGKKEGERMKGVQEEENEG